LIQDFSVRFTAAVEAEGITEATQSRASPGLQTAFAGQDYGALAELTAAGQVPLLLVVSDNGPQMRSYAQVLAALGRMGRSRGGQLARGHRQSPDFAERTREVLERARALVTATALARPWGLGAAPSI
jgi:hypothetical protein